MEPVAALAVGLDLVAASHSGPLDFRQQHDADPGVQADCP